MTFRTRLIGLGRLFRFELPFTAGICVVLGEMLALGAVPPAVTLTLGFLSVFFISAAALILNDYFDLEIDRINAPHRPLPAGLVTVRDVVALAVVVTSLGLVCSALLGLEALLVGVLVWFVGFLYNWRFKKAGLLGNLMVCFSVGMTFLFGGIAVGRPFEPVVWFFAVLVMLIDLGEEIAADAMDLAGDRQAGSRSLAVLLGPETALRLSGAIFVGVVLFSLAPFVVGWLGWVYLVPLALMDVVILYALTKLLNPRVLDRRRYIRWIYLSGLVALLLCVVLRLGETALV